MEDINIYLLTVRQSIELEYYKLKSEDDITNKLEINNIITIYDNIQDEINNENNRLEKINIDTLFLSNVDIENLLLEYGDGTYGILNYFNKNPNPNKIIEFIIDNNYEYYNKQSIINKLIKDKKITAESYGILFLYTKNDKSIVDLKKVYLLKNNDINYLNSDDTDEQIITKIYEFGTKIILKEEIYDNNFKSNIDLKLNEEIIRLTNEKKKVEIIYKLIKKYNKCIEENIKQPDIKQLFNNFLFVNTLIKKISDPLNKKLNIQDIIKFNYSKILDQVKISNRLEQSDYDTIIERHLDDSLDQLIDNTLNIYNIEMKFRPYLNLLFELLIRIYIENHLGYKSFCLSKSLIEYLKFSNLLSDPETNTLTLKRRHWNQLLDTKDNKKIISSILFLIKTRTHTLEDTFKYFELIFTEIKIKY